MSNEACRRWAGMRQGDHAGSPLQIRPGDLAAPRSGLLLKNDSLKLAASRSALSRRSYHRPRSFQQVDTEGSQDARSSGTQRSARLNRGLGPTVYHRTVKHYQGWSRQNAGVGSRVAAEDYKICWCPFLDERQPEKASCGPRRGGDSRFRR